jgi:hypothetical protein
MEEWWNVLHKILSKNCEYYSPNESTSSQQILPKTGQNKQINKQTQNLIRNDPEH